MGKVPSRAGSLLPGKLRCQFLHQPETSESDPLFPFALLLAANKKCVLLGLSSVPKQGLWSLQLHSFCFKRHWGRREKGSEEVQALLVYPCGKQSPTPSAHPPKFGCWSVRRLPHSPTESTQRLQIDIVLRCLQANIQCSSVSHCMGGSKVPNNTTRCCYFKFSILCGSYNKRPRHLKSPIMQNPQDLIRAPYVSLTVISPDSHHKDMWPQQLWLACYMFSASSSSNMEQTKERLTNEVTYPCLLIVSPNSQSEGTEAQAHNYKCPTRSYTRGRKLLQTQASKLSSCQTWCMWVLCHCRYSIKDFPNMIKYDCYIVPPLQDWRKIKWWSEEREDTVVFFEISLVQQIFFSLINRY